MAGGATQVAVVTGATGFLGAHLVEQLVNAGWRVICIHRKSADTSLLSRFTSVVLVLGDVTDYDSIVAAIPEGGCDAFFHVAADTNMWSARNDRQFQINVVGTRNVVNACLEKKVKRLIHTSTTGAYAAKDPNRKLTEDVPQEGGASWINYNKTKFLAEEEVRAGVTKGLDAVIMNPAHIIGKYDRHSWAQMFLMVHNDQLPAVPPGSGSFANAVEVAKAHVAAVAKGRTGENYLLGGPMHTTREFVEEIGKLLGKRASPPDAPIFLMYMVAYAHTAAAWFTGNEPSLTPEKVFVSSAQGGADSSKAVRELGFRDDVPMAESARQCYEYLVQVGDLPAQE